VVITVVLSVSVIMCPRYIQYHFPGFVTFSVLILSLGKKMVKKVGKFSRNMIWRTKLGTEL